MGLRWKKMIKKIDVKNKVLLFDLDGTLVDTEKLGEKALAHYCVDKNIFSDEDTLKKISKLIVGRTWKSAVQEIIETHQLSLDPTHFEQDLKTHYRNLLQLGVELIPGVHEKLSEFKAKSNFMGIVTGSARDEVDVILNAEGLTHLFDRIWSSEHYAESKPSPSPFLTAFEQAQNLMRSASGLEIRPEDIIVFEDSIAGMESAHRAGFSFIQVLHAHPEMRLDPRALFSIQDWHDLKIQ